MKKITLFIFSLFIFIGSFSQLPNGSFAPDWSMIDLDGTEHNLYAYLDDGYTVIIDFSAVWCPPCWSYHISGALEELYINHGPAGYSNVSENTTDDVMVFFIEGDEGTIAQLNGGSGSQGDWVTGTPYPIIPTVAPNNNQVTIDYSIGYWPTIYMICPDRMVTENGQISTEAHYEAAQGCPEPSTNTYDAKILDYSQPIGSYCSSSITPVIKLQNYGTENLTSVDIVSYLNDVENNTFSWTGNLGQYYYEEIVLTEIADIPDGDYTWKAVLANPNGQADEDTSNDIVESEFNINSDGAEIDMDLYTDNYPTETSWEITLNGEIIAEGDTYSLAQHHYLSNLCLEPDSCYVFTIMDEYGDGMSYGGVTGSIEITWNGFTLLEIQGDDFTFQLSVEFCVTEPVSVENDILTYSLPGQTEDASVNSSLHTINVEIPDTVDVTSLVAMFTISEFASIAVNGVDQVSGITTNDFTETVTYIVTAENVDEAEWTVTVTLTDTGIDDIEITRITIYPNPAKDALFISSNNAVDKVEIYNSLGSLVLSEYRPSNTINISKLTGGIYFINITSNRDVIKKCIAIVR